MWWEWILVWSGTMPDKKKNKLISFDEASSFCPHPPGSIKKIIFLEARLAYGLQLYHPKDNPIPIVAKDKKVNLKEHESHLDAEIHSDDDDF